jgi:phenylalanyl-tRNA synthetase beta subunit
VHLVFQAEDRTLTDADADAARARIVAALADRLHGELRA